MNDPLVIDLDITTKKVVALLQKTDKVFAFTGGLAAITYGDPRTTNDVDLIMEINPWERDFAGTLAALMGDDFYFSIEGCREAIDEQSMFQAIDKETMFKVDFHLADIVPGALERRRNEKIMTGRIVPMVSPEDSILSKLHWIKLGSGRSKKDVVAMLRVQENLDNDYLETTAEQLGVKPILDELRQIAESYDPHVIL
jgi:hypothetical protein